ncbi:hypothetical protein [Paludibaculum fermentans]|uniref:Uncharacterized protein n=1 Tax=Paludibaculum fermentans TaxID=1473598 RepID=A0A7S7NL80_PALFE|nr:hypothetical protein [Paludibaculum fermentans]QOY85698.1 hypothetical protein IRI77_23095 [Paludibaculum fermentans]
MLLCIRDETPSGQSLHEVSVEFLTERITVRELIRERVHQEVRAFNRRDDGKAFQGLVQPTETERVLNSDKAEPRFRKRAPIDWEAQFARALDGFARNAYFVIVDDRQVESLDEEIAAGPSTKISFVKLVPLVGG